MTPLRMKDSQFFNVNFQPEAERKGRHNVSFLLKSRDGRSERNKIICISKVRLNRKRFTSRANHKIGGVRQFKGTQ